MIYDLIVIGGGPAGMMAAGRAGERGLNVLLLEKNQEPGLKLLATGHGRCNLSNLAADGKPAMSVYGKNHKFLYSAFANFGVESVLGFFSDLGVETAVEDRGRIFPKNGRAAAVRQALFSYLKKNQVKIRCQSNVKGFVLEKGKISKVRLANGEEIMGRNFLLATGGKARPQTGSTGDAYAWLSEIGHTINQLRPALVPVILKGESLRELEGLSLKAVGLKVFQGKKKILEQTGDLIFTADGLSGPAILDLSGRLSALLPEIIRIELDLLPDIGEARLDKRLQIDFQAGSAKQLKNYLSSLIALRLVPHILESAKINGAKRCGEITKDERCQLLSGLKKFGFGVVGVKNFDQAMVTAGGIEIKEIDPKTMQSRLYPNLYLAGEILDLDGPSGGYNLQICWSTGFAAGDSVGK